MLNSIGLENPGVDYFLETTLPQLRQYDVPVIVNIYAHSYEDYGKVAKLDVEGVDALEINISCPNVKEGGLVFGICPDSAAEVVKAVKSNTSKMVITNFHPNVTDIVAMAQAVEAAGTDAISLINTLIGMKIDIDRQKPVLGNVIGGLSGPSCTSCCSADVLSGCSERTCAYYRYGRHYDSRRCDRIFSGRCQRSCCRNC